MLLERVYDADLAQESYFIGCQSEGVALVVDPRRDVDVYLRLAAEHGMTIVAVTETHIHADYLSGTRELAARTGARMHVSDTGGPDWRYGDGFDDAVRMQDGHELSLGKVTVRAVHTPGHTPEHLAFLVTDGAQATLPGFLLSGDFVFVGDVGRPDLLDEAAGMVDTRFDAARMLFASLRDRFLTLPDYVQVLPAHGSGSACGKALGAIPSTTVGYERAFAWWAPYLERGDEAGFVEELLSGQPDAHAYFARMKRQNRLGPEVLGPLPALEEYRPDQLQAALDAEAAVFVDTRGHASVHAGTVEHSMNIPGVTVAARYGAWVLDPETDASPVVVLARTPAEAAVFRDHLLRIGVDTVAGFVTQLDGLRLVRPGTVSMDELGALADVVLIDVRTAAEFATGHLPDAAHLSGGRVLWSLDSLPSDERIVTVCRSGLRSSLIASALRRRGFDVAELV